MIEPSNAEVLIKVIRKQIFLYMDYVGQEGRQNGQPSCCNCPVASKLKQL